MKKVYSSVDAPKAVGPYSQAVEANGMIFLAGQVPLTKEGILLDGDISAQTDQVMQNLKSVLTSADLNFDDVVRTEIFLVDMSDFVAVNEVYAKYMSEPYPARATVAVKELPKGAKVEISMIAVRN